MLSFLDYTELADIRLTDQFRNDPAIRALVKTIADVSNYYQASYIKFFNDYLDIDKSFGSTLDLIGRIVGQPRLLVNYSDAPYFGYEFSLNGQTFGNTSNPIVGGNWYSITNPDETVSRVLNDEEYRLVIKSRVIKNSSKATIDDLYKILNLLTGNENTIIKVTKNGEITIDISDQIGIANYFLSRYQYPDSVLPIPSGTLLKINYLQ